MTSSLTPLRIASRASALALWQANHVAELLRAVDPAQRVELVEVSTEGDRERTAVLSEIGGRGVFTREIQSVVLDGRADIAVHSLKDLPTETVDGLVLAGIAKRAPRFDVLVIPAASSHQVPSWDQLPIGARVGTGSPRRQAQLLHHRADLIVTEIRGNVETRLRKLDQGEYDAIVLAQAGLERLGLAEDRPLLPLRPPLMFPAVGQGALGLECRADDEPTIASLNALTHTETHTEVTAERACLRRLRAGCHAPVGVVTEVIGGELKLQGVVLSADGQARIAATHASEATAPEAAGNALADALLRQGAGDLIAGS